MAEDGYGEGGYGEGGYGDSTTEYEPPETGGTDGVTWRTSEYEDPTVELLDRLPVYLNQDLYSGNWKVLEPAGYLIRQLDDDLAMIERESHVMTAETLGSLKLIGSAIGVTHQDAEPLEHYRTRIIAAMQVFTSDGTVDDLVVGIANAMGIRPTAIKYEQTGPHTIRLGMPNEALNKTSMTAPEVAQLAEQMVNPIKTIEIELYGTFMFWTKDDAASWDGTDYEYGFASATDGTSTGGTFSTILEEDELDGES